MTPSRRRPDDIDELRLRLEEAESTIEAIRSGAVDAFIVKEDGTDRVYSLQTADRPYRTLVENMPEGALVAGNDGLILFSNRRFVDMVGVTETIVGSPLNQWIASGFQSHLRRLLDRGRTESVREEICLRRADGTELAAQLAASPLPLPGNEAMCIIVTDLTNERKRQSLERGQEEMRRSQDELRQADRRKDAFLATLAHELRNPLAPVMSLLEVLRLKGQESPDAEWARTVIERQVQRMARLVDDLVDLTRATSGRMEISREPLDLREAVRAALAAAELPIEEAGHTVSVSLPDHAIVVEGDRARLTQVVTNLLHNAVRFTPRFGRIDVAARAERDHATIAIRDTGDGIVPELLPKVFDMFMLTNGTPRHPQSGIGIGLALVRHLVMLHGGSVSVESPGPGEGSTFTVRLPTAGVEPRPIGDVTAALPAEEERGALRILIVDDSVDSADALATMLRLNGHEVRTAYDGRSALTIGPKFEPNVVLLDVGMPGMDGYETCRQLRQAEWGGAAHVVAVTGWGQPADREKTAEAGFDHHLVKPVDPADLRDLLARLASRRQTPWPEL